MLSISAPIKGAGHADYYLDLAREDYYTEGGEPPGQWHGSGAKALGLTGKVERDDLRSLFEGYGPDGQALVQNAGDPNRHSAWDLTFSAPKSVSVAWSQASPEMRQEIQAAHSEAVKAAISYLEDEAASTRRGKAGHEKEPASIVVATFEHGTSRAQDPQLHTHAVVANVAVREDGTTGALETKGIFAHKMPAGALYRAELSAQLEERLGLTSTKVGSWFELDNVPKALQEEFSKRRKEIEKVLEEKGASGAIASKIANLESREVKQHVPREALFNEWQKVGQEHGWSTQQVTELTQRERIERNSKEELSACLNQATTNITDRFSHFTKRELTRYAAEEAQGRGLSAAKVIEGVNQKIGSQDLVSLGVHRGENRYTTQEILQLEKQIIDGAISRKDETAHQLSGATLTQVLEKHSYLSEEQKNAVSHITQGKGSIRVMSGLAGVGKSSALVAAREAWELEGYKVLGAAPNGKIAEQLQDESKIPSRTIHSLLGRIERGRVDLDPKTIVVIDEAAMVGTKLYADLSKAVHKAGSQLILTGDEKQLQSVDAGGGFSYLSEILGRAEINTIRRQNDEWAREAVKNFSEGNIEAGLKPYMERGLVSVQETKREAINSIISDWKIKGLAAPQDNIMLAGTNLDVRELNERAQAARFAEGKLSEESVKVNGSHLHQGDRVLFTKNARHFGVQNGSLGTITVIDKSSITAKLDSGKEVNIDLEAYQDVRLGYAMTTHKSQGTTVKNVHALLGGNMQDRELSYVQASRAKNETRFYIDKSEAGEDLKDLTKQMERSREKTLATSLIKANENKVNNGQEQRR